jgi:transcriptional regulator with XRE-family HTH domain
MALFFDAGWFDARLAAAHLARADLARALGLADSEIAEMWKDQRELSARHVAILAALLNASAKEVADHAGISTPVPQAGDATLENLAARLARIEQSLEELKALVRELKRDRA